jgi:DNA-binding GntR family transcriptional regulator
VISQSADEWDHGHTALVNALVKGDGDQAAAIMKEHLKSARDAVLNAVMNSPALMQVNLAPNV